MDCTPSSDFACAADDDARLVALGSPLVPYAAPVDQAVERLEPLLDELADEVWKDAG